MNAPRGVLFAEETATTGAADTDTASSSSTAVASGDPAIQDTSPEFATDAAGDDISTASVKASLTPRNTSPSG